MIGNLLFFLYKILFGYMVNLVEASKVVICFLRRGIWF